MTNNLVEYYELVEYVGGDEFRRGAGEHHGYALDFETVEKWTDDVEKDRDFDCHYGTQDDIKDLQKQGIFIDD